MANRPADPALPERLHQNRESYRGERISVEPVLKQLREEAGRQDWAIHELTPSGAHPIWHFHRASQKNAGRPFRVYISAGIHGDEPAGVLAALQLIRQSDWPENVELTLFPCLNPAGMEANRRESPEGIDFNRDYRDPETAVIQAHVEWLEAQQDFDVALLLHEDWEADGFYLYELATAPEQSIAGEIVSAVSAVCPILQAARADDWPVKRGVVRANVDPETRPEWPEALFFAQAGTELCYTFEAPSDYAMDVRVSALDAAVNSVVTTCCARESKRRE